MPVFKVQIYRDRSLKEEMTLDETVVVGRQDLNTGDGLPISLSRAGKPLRLVVAEKTIHFRSACLV
jgi:hypothetical protein